MITTEIAIIFGASFTLFGLLAWAYIVKWVRSTDGSVKKRAESKIIRYGRLTILMLPLYFLSESILDVYFTATPNLGDIRVSLFGFIMTGVLFVGVLFRSRTKSRNAHEDS